MKTTTKKTQTVVEQIASRNFSRKTLRALAKRGCETRYLVRSSGGFKIYCYESDLSTADPLSTSREV